MRPTANSPEWNSDRILASWSWDEEQIRDWQLKQLNTLFDAILPSNQFYREKWGVDRLVFDSLDQLSSLPFTTKNELVASAAESPLRISTHHTFDRDQYSRLHRTSGTTGEPLLILDTQRDWKNWSDSWQHVLQAADVQSTDRVFLAFSFGPFIGFWSAHQAAVDRGATAIPGGGLSSLARLEFMRTTQPTVMCCTPSYALYLAEVADQENFRLDQIGLKSIIVAGEAGGSVASVRQRMADLWSANIVDHSGATEIGAWGFGWPDRPGLHVNETNFIAELLPIGDQADDANTTQASPTSAMYELVLTTLGRHGAPVIRYRTGDAVLAERPTEGPCRFLWLPSGVVGRADDMVTIRGVNIFPSSVDAVVRRFADVAEYRVAVGSHNGLDQLALEVEASETTAQQLEKELNLKLGLRIPVASVAAGSLPRSELKSKRWLDQRTLKP